MPVKKELDYALIGKRIRNARVKKGITQEELAAECQLSAAHIGHIERGTRIPSLETVVYISRALSVSLDELVFGIEEKPEAAFIRLNAMLKTKDKNRVKAYLSVIQALAEKIDDM